MIIGEKRRFAIELEILDEVDGWIFGTFIFWILDCAVGNQEDRSVDLKGCINWLKNFVVSTPNRYEPGLYELDKKQIYIQLCSAVLVGEGNTFAENRYQDSFSRFHISHIGMSSFDNVTMILVENKQKDVRCIWKQNDEEIREAFLKCDEINKVACNVIAYFEDATKTA